MIQERTLKWEKKKLGEIVSFKTGKLNSNASKPNGAFPFFTCSQQTFRTDTYSFDTECVLLGGNNANGVYPIKYFSGKFDAYQRTYIIRALDNKILSNIYLFFALKLKLELLKSISTGVATKFLTLTILNDIEIDLPPLPTQRKIASIQYYFEEGKMKLRIIGTEDKTKGRLYKIEVAAKEVEFRDVDEKKARLP